jgi:hypothetical protein
MNAALVCLLLFSTTLALGQTKDINGWDKIKCGKYLSLVAAALIAFSTSAPAQVNQSLVGTWKLISGKTVAVASHESSALYGEHPTGFITYTREGRVSVIIAADGRKPLSVADRIAAPAAERAVAFATFIAYAGRYTVSGNQVIHHIEVSSFQNWVNTDQTRIAAFQGNRVTFRTPPLMLGGKLRISEVVWELVN